ncbi:hypothetical protein M422DRAFT_50215 [Sphaerobolus stellatus SS14]|uniref:Uncharacterized protein n=1 Tax=Sphaerobolus stellatus (strain SS14) TaxID=990650 RepID=A0A0C9U4M6_SPHS4|nr:hypothetical protein M422DRAFT_50215 [Sphaerobolus stellatus SS14]
MKLSHTNIMSRWLYRRQIAIDANFKLKRKNVSSLKVDPGFGASWAYMVEPKKYRAHTSGAEYPKEENTCSGFHSVDDQEKTGSSGIETCGVGGTVCPRHGLVCPNGIADLLGGESYKHMDYVIFSALEPMEAEEVDISYDVACIWRKKLLQRIKLLPDNLKKPAKAAIIRSFIPKFHTPAHITDCQTTCSWYLLPGVAETGGEEIKHFRKHWDLLNAFFGDWNWRKYLKLGESLKKLLEALKEAPVHMAVFLAFSKTLDEKQVEEWKAMVEKWESDPHNAPNPYAVTTENISLAQVRMELDPCDKDEEMHIEDDDNNDHDNTMLLPAKFMAAGLALELMMFCLATDMKNDPPKTPSQEEKVVNRRMGIQ